jgi:hypothetical protein
MGGNKTELALLDSIRNGDLAYATKLLVKNGSLPSGGTISKGTSTLKFSSKLISLKNKNDFEPNQMNSNNGCRRSASCAPSDRKMFSNKEKNKFKNEYESININNNSNNKRVAFAVHSQPSSPMHGQLTGFIDKVQQKFQNKSFNTSLNNIKTPHQQNKKKFLNSNKSSGKLIVLVKKKC